MRKQAFTLIELLVVIAIIAILAAILFPVFAQAKLAAKATASLSNTKQLDLAVMMYANDYDDNGPLDAVFTQGNAGPLYFGGSPPETFWPWSYVILPYTKNSDILVDPINGSDPGNPFAGFPQDLWETYSAQYGYAYEVMSPATKFSAGIYGYTSQSLDSLTRPANMPMMTEMFEQTNTCPALQPPEVVGSFGAGWPVQFVNYSVDGPECNQLPQSCWVNWGSGTFLDSGFGSPTGMLLANYVNGAETGGVAWRRGGSQQSGGGFTTTGFADGHAKAMTPGALAVGTNYYYGIKSSNTVFVNNYQNTYMWSNNP